MKFRIQEGGVAMTTRRVRDPIEVASDLGAKAHDLYQFGDSRARLALREVAKVNPDILAWLRDRLLDITQHPEREGGGRGREPAI